MRLGGITSGDGDPQAMSTGNDYAELCDLGTQQRWGSISRGYQPPYNSSHHIPYLTTGSSTHIRSNSVEANELNSGPYGNSRLANRYKF